MLARHYKKATDEDSENILFLPDDSNLLVCHLMVVGLPYPYNGGEFILRLVSPDCFPQKPPEARSYTANGVYTPGSLICISIGEFHADDRKSVDGGAVGWRPALGIRGFARELVNGIIVPEGLNLRKHPGSGRGGLGIEDTTPAERVALAARSAKYNCEHNPKLREDFLKYAEAHPELKAAQTWRRQLAQQKLAGGCTREQLAEYIPAAFGVEFCGWAAASLPPTGNGASALLRLYRGLTQWDSDHTRKGYLAAQTILLGGTSAPCWAVLQELYPELGKKRPQLEALPPAELEKKLMGYLDRTMAVDFGGRAALLASL